MIRHADPARADAERREAMLDRIERVTELPLMILAFVMVPLLAAPLLWNLSPSASAVTFALDMFIWALFATDLAVKLAVAPRRLEYIRQHWLEVLIVLIPFARPLRLLRIIVFGSRAYRGALRLAQVDFLIVYAVGLVLIVATLVMSAERGHNSDLDSFPDALWWSVATVTTVGYGDVVPVTQAGRAFAYVLMIGGIGLFSALTANFASILVRKDDGSSAVVATLSEEVRSMREELKQLREQFPPE